MSSPVATGPIKKPVPVFLTSPLQVLKGHNEVSPQPSLLQAEQPQLSQPFASQIETTKGMYLDTCLYLFAQSWHTNRSFTVNK